MPGKFSAGLVRRRLADTEAPADPLDVEFSHAGRPMPARMVRSLRPRLRPAGVLIPLVERDDELTVILTERSADLRHHAGQISFPGGGMERHDADIVATALREAHEEVGISPTDVEVAGFLKPTPTVTGFAVTPVVGFVPAAVELTLDPVEVRQAFEVPLDFLMDAGNAVTTQREFEGETVSVISYDYDGHRIWGATAGILMALMDILVIK